MMREKAKSGKKWRMDMKRFLLLLMLLLMGLMLLPQLALANGPTAAAVRPLQVTVTAYTSPRNAVTASGAPAADGVVACPRRYRFGTRFKINGKIYVCQDRPNGKYDNRFDIWKPTKIAARAFGKQRLAVVRVTKPESLRG
jgi:3D (Asp-Asp-Asp) domain-containing protein